nr:dna polymerase alpha subunit b [Quercus suber]
MNLLHVQPHPRRFAAPFLDSLCLIDRQTRTPRVSRLPNAGAELQLDDELLLTSCHRLVTHHPQQRPTTMAETEAALKNLFAPHGGHLSESVLSELSHLLRLLTLEPQDLFFKWESYVQKMGAENTKLDLETVRDFKKDLQDTLERESRAKTHVIHGPGKRTAATPRAGGGGGGGSDVFGMLDGMVSSGSVKRKANNFDTPASKSARNALNSSPADSKTLPSTTIGNKTTAFEDRQNSGQITEQLNGHLPAAIRPHALPTEPSVKLKANTDLSKFNHRTMAMKLSEASEILDDRIDHFTDLVQAHHDLLDGAFGNPAAQSTAEIVAVGRIASDTPEGRLNAASLVLETSRRMGAGMRVPLKLENIDYDLFPGKIVALRGTNVSGEYFAATESLKVPLLPPAASSPGELDVHQGRLRNTDGEIRPLSMLVVSGPYTADTDLSFAPLDAILSRAEEQATDILILTGPYLDLEHPIVASGDFEPYLPANAQISPDMATMADVFRLLISQRIRRLVEAVPTITIIMVPSVRDAISKHTSWPQDRFPKQVYGLPKQVQVVTNPITLSINEIVFGISTQDVLSELRRENVYQAKGQAFNDDLLARLASGVIEQRHFFPVYPPQARENLQKPGPIPGKVPDVGGEERLALGASLDLGYYKLGEWLNVRPDVLVMPSVLLPFAKVSL